MWVVWIFSVIISYGLLLVIPLALSKLYLLFVTKDGRLYPVIKEFKYRFREGQDDPRLFFRRWRGLKITLVSLCITASILTSLGVWFILIREENPAIVWGGYFLSIPVLCFIFYQIVIDSLLTHHSRYKRTLFWSRAEYIDMKLLRHMILVFVFVGWTAGFLTKFLFGLYATTDDVVCAVLIFVTCFSIVRILTHFLYPIYFYEYDTLAELLRRAGDIIDRFSSIYEKMVEGVVYLDESFWRDLEARAIHGTNDDELAACLFWSWRDSLKI